MIRSLFTLLALLMTLLGCALIPFAFITDPLGLWVAEQICQPGTIQVDDVRQNTTEITCTSREGSRISVSAALIAPMTALLLAGIFMLVILGVGAARAKTRAESRLLLEGEQGQGRLLDMDHAGKQNNRPLMKLTIEYTPSGGARELIAIYTTIDPANYPYIQKGRELPLRYDRLRPKRAIVDWSAFEQQRLRSGGLHKAGSEQRLKDRLKELEEARSAGLITEREYQQARQRLIDAQ